MENERERPCLPFKGNLGLTGSEKLDQENVSPLIKPILFPFENGTVSCSIW